VVPHWIGLDRARREFEQLTDQEKQDSGGLVDPDLVADTVTTLALDDVSVGRVVVIRADREPYDLDPVSIAGTSQEPIGNPFGQIVSRTEQTALARISCSTFRARSLLIECVQQA
jgi:hypothetical protein